MREKERSKIEAEYSNVFKASATRVCELISERIKNKFSAMIYEQSEWDTRIIVTGNKQNR